LHFYIQAKPVQPSLQQSQESICVFVMTSLCHYSNYTNSSGGKKT